jgi:hypothetical protein
MAADAPSADDLLGQMHGMSPAGQPPQPQGPSGPDLITQMGGIAPPATPQPGTAGAPGGDQSTWRGVGRNVGAGMAEGGGAGLDILSDPVGNLVMRPLTTAGAFLYDAAAPYVGLPRLTADQRNDLTGGNATPEQRGPGSILVSQAGKAIGADPAAVVPQGPTEAAGRAAGAGAVLGGAFGGGILPAIAGTVGGAGGSAVSTQVPDWAAPMANLVTNALTQIGAGRIGGSGTSSVQPNDAATAVLARQKYGIPIDATDVTPGSPYRTQSGVQAKMDAWQAALVREVGEDPNTPDVLSRNRVTNDVMTNTATRAGQVMDGVANRTTIGPMQSYAMLQKVQQIENSLPLTPGLDIPAIIRNIAAIKQAVDPVTGQMTGTAAQAFTRTGGLLDKLEGNSNRDVANIGGQLSDAVDNAFIKSATPQDATDATQAKYQWRLMKTLQPLVAKASGGNIDPGAFMTQAVNASRRFDPSTGGIAYTGGGNIGELARIGALIKNGPQTTTPPPVASPIFTAPGVRDVINLVDAAGRRFITGPYARSGWNANQQFNNALTGPSGGTWSSGLLPGMATGSNALMTPTR